MCAECTIIEEDQDDVPMIFDQNDSDTPEERPNLLSGQGCCGGSCCNKG